MQTATLKDIVKGRAKWLPDVAEDTVTFSPAEGVRQTVTLQALLDGEADWLPDDFAENAGDLHAGTRC